MRTEEGGEQEADRDKERSDEDKTAHKHEDKIAAKTGEDRKKKR